MSQLPEKIKVPQELYRAAEVGFEGEGENRSAFMSISSDEPYLRYDWWNDFEYYEVIDHTKGGIEEGRLKAGLPLLWNHKSDVHLGTADSYSIDGKRCRISNIVWSCDEFAQNKKKDVESTAIRTTSVGYRILDDGEQIGERDGIPILKFKVEIYEGSLAPVPADFTVGPGRSREHKPLCEPREISIRNHKGIDNGPKNKQTPKPMNLDALRNQRKLEEPNEGGGGGGTVTVEVVAEKETAARKAGETATRELFVKLQAITDSFQNRQSYIAKPLPELQAQAFREGKTETEYKELILSHWGELRTVDANGEAPAKMGLSKKDMRNFRLTKLVSEMHGMRSGGKGPTGFEKEVSEQAAKFYHDKDARNFEGFCIPHDIAEVRNDENFDLNSRQMDSIRDEVTQLRRSLNATVFSAGGALVGTDLLAGSFIDLLRNATLIGQGPLGILELNGLVGNIAIPKQTSTTTVYWLAEGAAITESQLALAQLALSPKRMGAMSSYTKQLLNQASLSVEMLVRQDIALAMGVEEDRVIIQGAGGPEPLGITNTTGVGANVTFSGAATWADLIAFEYNLENANVRTGQMAFLTNPQIKSFLKQTLVVSASTFPIFLWQNAKGEFPTINGVRPGIMNEYPAYATKNSPALVIFGVFNNNVTKARWGGFDVVLDPYTSAASETVRFIVNQWIDVGIRYPQAFEVSTDAPTA